MLMSIFAELKLKLLLDWECVEEVLCLSYQFLCLFCVLSSEREGYEMFHQHILIYNSYKGYNKHRRLKLCCFEG